MPFHTRIFMFLFPTVGPLPPLGRSAPSFCQHPHPRLKNPSHNRTTGYRFIKGAIWTRGTNSLGEVPPNNNVDEQNAVLETEQYF